MGLVSDDIHHRKTPLLICNANLCVLYNKRKSCRAFPIAPDKISKCKQLSCCEVIDTFADSCWDVMMTGYSCVVFIIAFCASLCFCPGPFWIASWSVRISRNWSTWITEMNCDDWYIAIWSNMIFLNAALIRFICDCDVFLAGTPEDIFLTQQASRTHDDGTWPCQTCQKLSCIRQQYVYGFCAIP